MTGYVVVIEEEDYPPEAASTHATVGEAWEAANQLRTENPTATAITIKRLGADRR